HLQSPLIFLLLLIQEQIFFQSTSICWFMTLCQFLMFFENISAKLAVEKASLGCFCGNKLHFRTLFQNCRRTQVLIAAFNSGYAPVVYLFKLMSISASILFGYLGIRYFSKLDNAFAAFLL
ncbi:unnamed protein product, partial [Allacma fusca]